jgi:hypothetical protein
MLRAREEGKRQGKARNCQLDMLNAKLSKKGQ